MKIIISDKLGTESIELGGPGSGNWAHIGRPGKVGGSSTRESGMTVAKGQDWLERYKKRSGRTHPFEKERAKSREEARPRAKATTPLQVTAAQAQKQYGKTDSNPGVDLVSKMGQKDLGGASAFTNYSTRGEVKHELVTQLAELSGEDYDLVNRIVKQWSYSSNDTDYRSLSLQEYACEELGMELSKWQKSKIAGLGASADESNTVAGEMGYSDPKARTKRVLRAMYDYTQEQLAKNGITEVTLFRGIGAKVEGAEGSQAQWIGNSLESWSVTYPTALQFSTSSGVVVGAKIPASRIFCTCRTGFGCLSEEEFLVIGNAGETDVVTIVKPSSNYTPNF